LIIGIRTFQRHRNGGTCPHDPSWWQLYELTGIDVCALVNRFDQIIEIVGNEKPNKVAVLDQAN
jgi:hypothetical protein